MRLLSFLKVSTWLFFSVVLISGCATVGEWFEEPTSVETTFKTSKNVNRDKYGNPRAIWLRVYLLKSTGAFEGAKFFDLKEHDQDILAKDLMTWKPLWFNPGDEMVHKFSIDHNESPEESLFVAVMAGYRDIGNARWQAMIEVPSRDTSSLVIYLEEMAVRLELMD